MTLTLTGSNSFELHAQLTELVGNFVAEHGDLAVERLDGEEASFNEMLGAIESMPFLASKKLVIIHNLGANKQAAEQIEKLLDGAGETVDIVLVEPKPDKRGVYYKMLKKRTDLQEFNDPDEQSSVKWLIDAAKAGDGQFSSADARYLVMRVGMNQQLMANELTKLLAYDKKITRGNIDLLTEQGPEGTVFNLLDAAFAGNKKQVIELYESLRAQRIEPQAMLAMLVWQLYPVALIQSAGDRSVDEIARDTKLNPFVLRKSKSIADRLGREDLSKLLDLLTDLDRRFKSEPIDADEALQYVLMSLTKK